MSKRPLIFVGTRSKINELAWTADRLGHPVLGVLDHQYVDQPHRCPLPILGDERWLLDQYNEQAQTWLRDCDFFVGSAYFGAQQHHDNPANLERLRYQRINLLEQVNANVVNLIDPENRIEQRLSNRYCDIQIGRGVYISWNSDIQPTDVTIGDYCSLETGSFVGHKCKLGRNVTILPFANINHCIVGDHACIGMNARTASPTHTYHIGPWSTVYFNSVIGCDVPDNSIYTPSGKIRNKSRSLDWK